MVILDKKTLRKVILDKRSQLSKDEILSRSEKIKDKLFQLKEFQEANFIFSFISFQDEVHTHDIITETISIGKRVGVPITIDSPRQLLVSELKDFHKELELGFYNILTPKKEYERIVSPELVDLVLVPGLAFDRSGYRVGYGGGYYDRFFASLEKKVPKVALCFDLQILPQVPKDDFDVPVDYIITENEIIGPIKGN